MLRMGALDLLLVLRSVLHSINIQAHIYRIIKWMRQVTPRELASDRQKSSVHQSS